MGLKVAEKMDFLMTTEQLQVVLARVERYNQEKMMNTMNQLILGFSLKLICKGLEKSSDIQGFLLDGHVKIEELFMNGLLSKNSFLRRPYL